MLSFKRFLYKLLIVFVLVTVLFSLLINIGIDSNLSQGHIRKELKEKEGTIETIVVGSSKSAQGIDPNIVSNQLNTKCFNISANGASLSARLSLAKQYIMKNPVKSVILDVSIDSMVLTSEQFGHQGQFLAMQRMNKTDLFTYFIKELTISEKVYAIRDLLKNGKSVIVNRIINNTNSISNNYVGNGYYIGYDSIKYFDESYLENYQKLQINTNVISKNEEQLCNFISLCNKQNISLYLVYLPDSSLYVNQYSNIDEGYNYFKNICYNNCKYINFNLLKEKDLLLPNQESYYDDTHLTTNSSTIVTNKLCELIKMLENNSSIEDLFYDSNIQKLEQTMN